ncbi:MAG: carbohydrate ABC transporter permease [Oscillospiraceae bacterium]|nr:carbohydrate ABC transporter permease [Oscillospiraceae bacterium]
MTLEKRNGNPVVKVIIYIVCIALAVMSIFPFVVMVINSTRSTYEVQQHAVSLIPSSHLMDNFKVFEGKPFNPWRGFLNSLTVAVGATVCTVYFSTLTAYALVAYTWKARDAFFTFILCVMMIPAQVTAIGFYQFMYRIHMTNNLLALILPAIYAPSAVFFMRQFMLASLPLELLDSARIDGSKEFHTFNRIAMPIMKPAMATQGIFCFVNTWNNLFIPSILLTRDELKTMPIMVSLLKGDIYKTEYGAIYLGLTLTVLPLFFVYFTLSKYIIAGVALGGVKG